jgi:ribosomal protein L16 Arg81 hydroxylase
MPIDFNITEQDFKLQIQGTKPYLFKNALKQHAIDWKLVNELISRHDHTSSNFKLLKNGLILKYDYLEQYQEVFTTKYRANKFKLYELMKSGASLALNKIENCPETDQIRTRIAHFTGRQTIVSGYAAFGSEPSFGNHWDTHDVFAVQLIGKKTMDHIRANRNQSAVQKFKCGERGPMH